MRFERPSGRFLIPHMVVGAVPGYQQRYVPITDKMPGYVRILIRTAALKAEALNVKCDTFHTRRASLG